MELIFDMWIQNRVMKYFRNKEQKPKMLSSNKNSKLIKDEPQTSELGYGRKKGEN